jgi:hypothetical protein
VQGEGAGEDVDVGTVEGQVVTGDEEVEGERRSSLTTPTGPSAGVATVDSREIERGTKEYGVDGQTSNAVERD